MNLFRRYHAASHAQGNSRNANMNASLAEISLDLQDAVDATGWAE